MPTTLEERLLRMLDREEREESRNHREMRAQPIDVRVNEGECIAGAVYLGERNGTHGFRVAENLSRFRAGDLLVVGDGLDLERAAPLVCGEFDANKGVLLCAVDSYQRGRSPRFDVGSEYVVDRRPRTQQGRLRDYVREAFATPRLAAVLAGDHVVAADAGRHTRAVEALASRGLNDVQVDVGAAAIATESLALVQGPPGTGKTRLLAAVVAALCARGCRVALCAFTHRAVDNALLAIRREAPDLKLIKLAAGAPDARSPLRGAGVESADAKSLRTPEGGCVVAGTCFQIGKLHEREGFHYAIFDEAGQMPVPHALPAMARSARWLFFGDHMQLPPVIARADADPQAAQSVFEFLHERYGSRLLDVTYRMNEAVCRVVSETFYGGRLHPAPAAAGRRMPFVPGGKLDEALDPAHGVTWLRIDHRQPGQRSPEEIAAVGDLIEDLVRRHGVPPQEIAVIAPFRAQVSQLRAAIERRQLTGGAAIVCDTVDSIQGQEREVVIVSLTVGDASEARVRGGFHLSLNRINVALSRARTKAVLVASAHAFLALPDDPAGLRHASRCKELRARLHEVDLTRLYASVGG
ncbi:MAG: ATP-binding protein [Phycisphaerales bacterium]|nr:ATP-binding protein [Phycisphaerales bacterium]